MRAFRDLALPAAILALVSLWVFILSGPAQVEYPPATKLGLVADLLVLLAAVGVALDELSRYRGGEDDL